MIARPASRGAPDNHRGSVAVASRTPRRTDFARTGQDGVAACEAHAFLSPEWIRAVIQAVEVAGRTDPYFRNLTGDLSFSLIYTVRDIPGVLRKQHDGRDEVEIFVELQRGIVRKSLVGGDLSGQRIHLRLMSDYQIARKLFVGKGSLLTSFLRGKLKVEPVESFHRWPQLATKSVLAAGAFLRLARKVPTVFVPQS